jgi:hypothetical protein
VPEPNDSTYRFEVVVTLPQQTVRVGDAIELKIQPLIRLKRTICAESLEAAKRRALDQATDLGRLLAGEGNVTVWRTYEEQPLGSGSWKPPGGP